MEGRGLKEQGREGDERRKIAGRGGEEGSGERCEFTIFRFLK